MEEHTMLIRLLDTDGLREAFDNSPALQRWVKAPKTRKVPSGTTERFFRPCGTLLSWVRAVPSAEALGYFHGIPPFTPELSSNRISRDGSAVPCGILRVFSAQSTPH